MLQKKNYSKADNIETFCESNLLTNELEMLLNDSFYAGLASYILYKISSEFSLNNFTYKDFLNNKLKLDDDVRFLIEQRIHNKNWKEIIKIGKKYEKEVLWNSAVINISASDYDLHTQIKKLISNLLDIQDSENVADLCCGSGDFLHYLHKQTKKKGASFTGISINSENIVKAKISYDLNNNKDENNKISYKQKNIFDLCLQNNNRPTFDKIVSGYSMGTSLRSMKYASDYIKHFLKSAGSSAKITSTDWIFNSVICEMLSEKGIGVGIMASGGTWNSSDKDMRKYFIERGLIKSVISLPSKIFEHTNTATSLIIFSKGNENVTFLDLTNCYTAKIKDDYFGLEFDEWGRESFKSEREKEETGGDSRFYERYLPDYIMSKIPDLLNTNTDVSRIVSKQEIIENDYNLNPVYYMDNAIIFENSVSFGNIITKITRGVPCKSEDIGKNTSSAETQYKYLTVANISNGLIDNKLMSLTEIDSKFDKYCVKENDLIISKSGLPYKIAVSEINQYQVLANDNLFIITLNKNKANPFYVKAFLDSRQGRYILKRASVGSITPNIGINAIKKLQIPLPPLSEQNRIATLLLAAKDEYLINKSRMEKSVEKLLNVFDDNIEG